MGFDPEPNDTLKSTVGRDDRAAQQACDAREQHVRMSMSSELREKHGASDTKA